MADVAHPLPIGTRILLTDGREATVLGCGVLQHHLVYYATVIGTFRTDEGRAVKKRVTVPAGDVRVATVKAA
jgi:hypothetical protein